MKKKISLALVVIFVLMQLYRPERNVSTEIPKTDFIQTLQPPKDIAQMIKTSCYDCHSNNTAYPWYVNVAPVSWFMAHHIDEAKEELNFSEWDTFSAKRKNKKLDEIEEMVDEGEMPMSSYLLMHSEAKLSDEQTKSLIDWVKGLPKYQE